jgi:hypothetical protein
MYSLFINDSTNEFFYKGKPITTLQNVKMINLFVGANNSRKSRFIRKIAAKEKQLIIQTFTSYEELIDRTNEIIERLKAFAAPNPDFSLLDYQSTRRSTDNKKKFGRLSEYFHKEIAPVTLYFTFIKHLEDILGKIQKIKSDQDIEDVTETAELFFSFIDFLVYIYTAEKEGKQIAALTNHMEWPEENLNAIDFRVSNRDEWGKIRDVEEKIHLFMDIRRITQKISTMKFELWTGRASYIPVLRSARTLIDEKRGIISNTIFESTISQQYFHDVKSPPHLDIHTGQNLYDRIDKAKRGWTVSRADFGEFEKFIGKNFYQSKPVEIVAFKDGEHQEIIISLPGERPDTAIHNVGDGVQAIINLFFPIFTANDGAWVYIDEPELNLHPGFQNLFIRTLLENEFLKNKKLRYFINSHSNHILSEALLGGDKQTEIYVFHRRDEDSSTIEPFEGIKNATLDLLGVLNTSTLVSNCSIWVEGITDRLYIRAFLTAYLKTINGFQPIEGLNYAFIEYGGKNLVHYDFDHEDKETAAPKIDTFFINRKVFLIADTDTKKEVQHAYYHSLETLSFIYRQTIVPEIENLIPQQILGNYLKTKLGLDDKQAEEVIAVPYDQEKLGSVLSKQLKLIGIDRKIEAKTGGTLASSYKSSLAEFVLQEVQQGTITWDMLSANSILSGIIADLYNFISQSNQMGFSDGGG